MALFEIILIIYLKHKHSFALWLLVSRYKCSIGILTFSMGLFNCYSPLSVISMARITRLTWGLSLCKLKIHCLLLDAGVSKQTISPLSSASNAYSLKNYPISNRRDTQTTTQSSLGEISSSSSNEGIGLALLVDSQLAPHCSSAKLKLAYAGCKW